MYLHVCFLLGCSGARFMGALTTHFPFIQIPRSLILGGDDPPSLSLLFEGRLCCLFGIRLFGTY